MSINQAAQLMDDNARLQAEVAARTVERDAARCALSALAEAILERFPAEGRCAHEAGVCEPADPLAIRASAALAILEALYDD